MIEETRQYKKKTKKKQIYTNVEFGILVHTNTKNMEVNVCLWGSNTINVHPGVFFI